MTSSTFRDLQSVWYASNYLLALGGPMEGSTGSRGTEASAIDVALGNILGD